MRILSTEPFSKTLSQVVGELVGKKSKNSQKILHAKYRNHEQQFLAWRAPSTRNISMVAGFSQQPKLQIKMLEQFLFKMQKMESRFYGLVTSTLLSETIDNTSGLTMGKAKAVQKMVSLIKTSVRDMQSIAMLNICSFKG